MLITNIKFAMRHWTILLFWLIIKYDMKKTRLKKYVYFYWKTLEYVSYKVQNPLQQCKRGFRFFMQRLMVSEKYITQ